MADIISVFEHDSKEEKYHALYPQLEALIAPESDLVANLSNIAAALTGSLVGCGQAFIWLKTTSLFWGHFRGQLLAHELERAKEFAARLGLLARFRLFLMWRLLMVIFLVVHTRVRRLLFRFLNTLRLWPYWISTVKNWMILTLWMCVN